MTAVPAGATDARRTSPGPTSDVPGEVLLALGLLALGVLPALFVLPHDRLAASVDLPLLAWLPLGIAGVVAIDRVPRGMVGWTAVAVATATPVAVVVSTLPGVRGPAGGPGWVLPLLAVAAATVPARSRAQRRWRTWIALSVLAGVVASFAAWEVDQHTTFGVVASLALLGVAATLVASVLVRHPRPVREPLLEAGLVVGVLAVGVAAGGATWSFAVHEQIFAAEVVGALAAAVSIMMATPAAIALRRRYLARRYGTGLLSVADLATLSGDLGREADPRTLLATAGDLVGAASGAEAVEIVLDEVDGRPGWAAFPLVVGDERVGTLSVLAAHTEGLEPRQERVVRQLAPTVALAARAVDLAVAARHARSDVIHQRDAERARILADLHDDLGPALAGMGMRVEAARASGGDVDLAALGAEIAGCRADLRRIVSALTPQVLVGTDLRSALTSMVGSFATADGPGVTLVGTEVVEVEGPRAIVAYRFAAEAVTNAVRHADASRVEVRVTRSAGGVVVSVEDDGRGGPVVPGVGLTSLDARAREVGGSLESGPSELGGVVVRLVLPGAAP